MKRWLLTALALLAFSPAAYAEEAPPPSSVSGRFVDARGGVLEVEGAAGRLKVRLGLRPGGDEGLAVWADSSLVVVWSSGPPRDLADAGAVWRLGNQSMTTFAAGTDKGRLTLAAGERTFIREGNTPWWRLKPETRAELTPRLGSWARRDWALPDFNAWYAKTYEGTHVEKFPEALAERTFDQLDAKQRLSLLALYAKLRKEKAWTFIGTIVDVGRSGEINFLSAGTDADMHSGLDRLGFADEYLASKGVSWGVRSKKAGVELHFKDVRRGDDLVNVHIDFFNPTTLAEGAIHIYEDLDQWAEAHTAARVAAEVRDQGIAIEFSPEAP